MRDRSIPVHHGVSRGAGLLAALFLVGGLCAACSSSPSSGVASLGHTTTSVAGGPAGNSGPPPSPKLQAAQLSYAKCMRSHGLVNFPDPYFGGGYPNGYMHRIDAASPQYRRAVGACRPFAAAADMLPWSKAQMAAHEVVMLRIAECMRAHGISWFPDPNRQGGFEVSSGSSGDTDTTQYMAAAKRCGGPPGGSPPSGAHRS